jgi:hypothetical protein
MKLEFLASGSPDCPLIRLYDFDVAAAERLRELFRRLSDASLLCASLHEQLGVEAIDGCRLDLRLGSRDCGIVQTTPSSFECILTAEGWSQVVDLLEPFCGSVGKPRRYQWLNEDGEVSLLLSPLGSW